LPRIKSDFVALIESAIDSDLGNFKIEFDEEKKLVCVVICSNGYPEDYKKNIEIKNLRELEKRLENGEIIDGVKILHAGTIEKDGKILAIGGRVLNIIASDKNFSLARQKAYKIVDMIGWKEGFTRKDIAKKVEDY
jgi:phosphoribosylamine--glycine ligase